MTIRRVELEQNLAFVRQRIAAACAEAGRSVESVILLPVTKTFPAVDLELLAELGCTDVGESRDQEARSKRAECTKPMRWHMIGQVQRRKTRQILEWADVVESVDRPELADALSSAAVNAAKILEVLIQVSLAPAEQAGRGGVSIADVAQLTSHVLRLPGLRLSGVMAVAPLGADPLLAFGALPKAHEAVLKLAPEATVISAGMSGDLEAAIACGATQVRIGGAILGNRPPLK
ncbi:MAG: YggS family pyridoxal phosphate-dependent enzyme [Actinomycetota bacterium]|nr:YggS family pyridoxal phosphate-dependent enzyme [Actinomycetota bacterium]